MSKKQRLGLLCVIFGSTLVNVGVTWEWEPFVVVGILNCISGFLTFVPD